MVSLPIELVAFFPVQPPVLCNRHNYPTLSGSLKIPPLVPAPSQQFPHASQHFRSELKADS